MESRGQEEVIICPITQYVMVTKPGKWVLHATIEVKKLYGWNSSNFAESENGAAIPMRFMYPSDLARSGMEKFTIPKTNRKVKKRRQNSHTIY